MTRSTVHEELEEDNLVHISVLLVDKNSQEYVEKYNEVRGCEIWGYRQDNSGPGRAIVLPSALALASASALAKC